MSDFNYKLPETLNPIYFPAKLWRIVNNPDNSAIWWNDTGDVIVIDQQLFEQLFLSPSCKNDNEDSFKLRQFSSFIRQLHLYGFKKQKTATTASDTVEFTLESIERKNNLHYFFNANFKRDNPAHLIKLQRSTAENKAKMNKEPYFHCRPSPPPYYNNRVLPETPSIRFPVSPWPVVPSQGGYANTAANPYSQGQRHGHSYGPPMFYGMQSPEQYHPGSFQYRPYEMAVPNHMNMAFPMGFYPAPSPLDLIVADYSRGSQNKEENKTGCALLDNIFRMTDTVRLNQPNKTTWPSGPSVADHQRMTPENKTVLLTHQLPDTKVDSCKVEEPEVEVLIVL